MIEYPLGHEALKLLEDVPLDNTRKNLKCSCVSSVVVSHKVTSALNHLNIFLSTHYPFPLFVSIFGHKKCEPFELESRTFHQEKSKPSIKNYLQMTMPFQETAMT